MRLSALRLGGRARATVIGTCAVLVVLIAVAFAVGGSGASSPNRLTIGTGEGVSGVLPADAGDFAAAGGPVPEQGLVAAPPDVGAARSTTGGVATDGPAKSAHDAAPVGSGPSLGATRIVKTGNLTIRVGKDRVGPVTQLLSTIATSHGGYVAQSNTALDARSPYGEVVLRIPVGRFDAAVAAARKLGDKVVSLTTSADDVTGRFVDLNARKHALERTRQTYLAILARAKTIGETLSVQQRIDDVQQQLDQLHGQLKLLNNQASYSTLTVDVVASGSDIFAATHERQGIDKAWHDSWSRFGRGVNAIVGAIGPIVFAILLIAVVGLIGFGGYRGVRRVVARDQAAS